MMLVRGIFRPDDSRSTARSKDSTERTFAQFDILFQKDDTTFESRRQQVPKSQRSSPAARRVGVFLVVHLPILAIWSAHPGSRGQWHRLPTQRNDSAAQGIARPLGTETSFEKHTKARMDARKWTVGFAGVSVVQERTARKTQKPQPWRIKFPECTALGRHDLRGVMRRTYLGVT
ncbi:hypothetical protein BU26DRAFT_116599 [Trematosphaeria pertusa]|uniref:Uncharacterized protein n=1 Tax=Trematosphaeria pertusa TaxID=390896 RepID=A0A6A6I0E1_9PLEO|nr:uncharacterized protein BU26DRAFT_116599 [Trematosphaeria pertusa]KAF2243353.1 hypothetical protein BU26DRAFT_116599 [Trematosphaeria pertusa]